MAFGDSPDDEPLRAAWHAFCDRLRDAGDKAFKDHNPANPLQRADAFRFLTQNLAQAFDLALETKDPAFPIIHPFCTPTRKLGGDAADFTYRQAWIDGAHAYRITGTLGTARFLNITVQGARPATNPHTGAPSLHEPFGDIPEANLFRHQIEAGPDGAFDLFVGGEQGGPNWLPTTPGSRKLFIREGFDAWDETPTPLSIERIGMAGPRPLPGPAEMVTAFEWAGDFITGVMRDWPDHPYAHSGGAVDIANLNAFAADPSGDGGADTKRGRAVAHMVWRLAPDEALIVEFESHPDFWMVSTNGAFMNSMDYLYRPVSYTPARTKIDADGKVRLVIAHTDPGVHNWLDGQGFALGNLDYRGLMSTASPRFATHIVKRAQLREHLPPDTAFVTPEQRSAQTLERFRAIKRRYGL